MKINQTAIKVLRISTVILLFLIAVFQEVFEVTWIAMHLLWFPFALFLRHPPFVYEDKPFYITYVGAFFTATFWSIVVWVVLGFVSRKWGRTKDAGDCEPSEAGQK